MAGRAGKRAVRRVRFERPYGTAGRRLLAYSVFYHHPAHHRTGKRHGGADVLPDVLRVDGGLLGAALCAAQRVHVPLPSRHLPCAGQYPRPAAGQASDAAAGYGAGSFLRLVQEHYRGAGGLHRNHPCAFAAGDDGQYRGRAGGAGAAVPRGLAHGAFHADRRSAGHWLLYVHVQRLSREVPAHSHRDEGTQRHGCGVHQRH